MKSVALTLAVAVFLTVGNQKVSAEVSPEGLYARGYFSEFVECAALFDLFEDVPGAAVPEERLDVDFKAAAEKLYWYTVSYYGADLYWRMFEAWQNAWATAEPNMENAHWLRHRLITCEKIAYRANLPVF